MPQAVVKSVVKFRAAGANTTESERDLVWKHFNLIESIAKSLGIDSPFVGQVGLEALFRAAQQFDPSKSQFKTYAATCVRREFLMYMRNAPQDIQMPEFDKSTLNDIIDEAGDIRKRGLTLMHEDIHTDKRKNYLSGQFGPIDIKIIEELQYRLPDDEWKILHEYFVDGDSLERIGIRRGVIRQTIHARIKRILKKARHGP